MYENYCMSVSSTDWHATKELRPHRRVKEGHHLQMTDHCSNVSENKAVGSQ